MTVVMVGFFCQALGALSTNQLIYHLDFDDGTVPDRCIAGTGNVPVRQGSPVVYTPSSLTWHAAGGVGNSGYIQTQCAIMDSLKFANPSNLPVSCTDFSVSFKMRRYRQGNALFVMNGATLNTTWTIWGVNGGNTAWKDANGNATALAPAMNTGDEWQSVIFSIKNRTLTVFIDGRNRGTFTFNNNFEGSPRLTTLGLGCTGAGVNNSVEADFDDIALWSTAITSEEDARALMASRPDQLSPDDPSAPAVGIYNRTWNFNNLEDWFIYNQNTPAPGENNPAPKTIVKDGLLQIFVRAGTSDRRKVRTPDQAYTTGRYKWRVYLPKLDIGGRSSIGAWIYCDDQHELDFEIGSGTSADRASLGAGADDLVAVMTTQANPFKSGKTLIKTGWHTVELDLTLVGGNYKATWIIDGVVKQTVQQTFGANYRFYIHCSVENLGFIGDWLPRQDNHALFDRMEYHYHP